MEPELLRLRGENRKLGEQVSLFQDLLKVQVVINELLWIDSGRYLAFCKEYAGTHQTADALISAVIKPDAQLETIYRALAWVFSTIVLSKGYEVHVTVMEEARDGGPERLVFTWYNKTPLISTTPEYKRGETFQKNSRYSASIAWQSHQMIIVPDIEAELHHHRKKKEEQLYCHEVKDGGTRRQGSLISYSVFDEQRKVLVCVVNMYALEPQCFTEEKRWFYQHIFYQFSILIVHEARKAADADLLRDPPTSTAS